jgi:FkbM family methyltransferase
MMFGRTIARVLNALGWDVMHEAGGLYRIERRLRFGNDHTSIVRQILGRPVRTIFDVGANVGQTALTYASAFPDASIYSFEPGREPFGQMQAAVRDVRNIHPFNVAMGRSSGRATLNLTKGNQANSLLPVAPGGGDYAVDPSMLDAVGSEDVEITSVDDFCRQNSITEIDLLKIDAQGYEIEVLAGSQETLARGVPLIYAEVTFVRYYQEQPLFPDVYTYLYDRGYRFVGLFDSGLHTHWYHVGGNVLFVHESFGERAPRKPRLRLGPVVIR